MNGKTKYNNFLQGLQILQEFAVEVNFENVPKSFSNSAPNHSHDNYCDVEVNENQIWLAIEKSPKLVETLNNFGWRSEQEDTFWIFR